jgi:hypothetical protein
MMANLLNPDALKKLGIQGSIDSVTPSKKADTPRSRLKAAKLDLIWRNAKRHPIQAAFALFITLPMLGAMLLFIGLVVMAEWSCVNIVNNTSAEDPAVEAEAVRSVQDNFEPAYAMLALNPDTASGLWFAHEASVGYGCADTCYIVTYSVEVMPEAATESERMHFEWLYDPKSSAASFLNTAAHTYFQPKGEPSSAESGADSEGADQ